MDNCINLVIGIIFVLIGISVNVEARVMMGDPIRKHTANVGKPLYTDIGICTYEKVCAYSVGGFSPRIRRSSGTFLRHPCNRIAIASVFLPLSGFIVLCPIRSLIIALFMITFKRLPGICILLSRIGEECRVGRKQRNMSCHGLA